MESKRLTIEQMKIWERYYSEWKRERYYITRTDSMELWWVKRKVLRARVVKYDGTLDKNETYLTKNDVENNFFHLSLNTKQWT